MDNSKSFSDSRGTITDLLVTPDYSITHITFKRGAVRGNHFHKKTNQIDILLKGKLHCKKQNKKMIQTFEWDIVSNHEVLHEAGEPHAYKALEDSEIVSLCFGLRKGADYEKDTFRLEKKLL